MWDGEVAGMAEGLASLPHDGRKLLILADSKKAAISAVKRAGRMGKARSRHLEKVVNMRMSETRLVDFPGGRRKTPAVYQSAITGLISWEVGRSSYAGCT